MTCPLLYSLMRPLLGVPPYFFCTLGKAARNTLCKQPAYTEVHFHLSKHSCHACWLTEVCEARHVPPAQRAKAIYSHSVCQSQSLPSSGIHSPITTPTPHPCAQEPSQQLSPASWTPKVTGALLYLNQHALVFSNRGHRFAKHSICARHY